MRWRVFYLESNEGSLVLLYNGVFRASEAYGSPKVTFLEVGSNLGC